MSGGETLSSVSGSGAVVWQPTRDGTYTLTHKVMNGETQVGATLTATFEVSHFPAYTETQTIPELVPYVWLRECFPEIADEFEAYESAALATAANGVNKVWECYVAGLVPTNAAAWFEARIEIDADGTPHISWVPDLNENGTKQERVYTVEGKAELTDSWGLTNNLSRFFHVKVGMPE